MATAGITRRAAGGAAGRRARPQPVGGGPRAGPQLGQPDLRGAARLLLAVLRGVPELVWALLFVRVFGLGPAAGVLALGITYGGMLGKGVGDPRSTDARGLPAACSGPAAGGWQRPSYLGCCQRSPELLSTPYTAGSARCGPRW